MSSESGRRQGLQSCEGLTVGFHVHSWLLVRDFSFSPHGEKLNIRLFIKLGSWLLRMGNLRETENPRWKLKFSVSTTLLILEVTFHHFYHIYLLEASHQVQTKLKERGSKLHLLTRRV